MNFQHEQSLCIKPELANTGVYQSIRQKDVGWNYLNFEARVLRLGETWEYETGDCEYGIVLLSGLFSV